MSAEEIAAQQVAATQQMPAQYMQYQEAVGAAAAQVAGVDVLVGVAMNQGTSEEQHQALQHQYQQFLMMQQSHGVHDPNMQGVPMIVQVPMQPGMDAATASAQGLNNMMQPQHMDGTLVDPLAAGSISRFKPATLQREEMENCVRNGQYKRKCKELEDYARQEGLPYKAVLSWFDRNKSRLMLMDQQPQTTVVPCGSQGPDGAMVTDPNGLIVPVNNAPQRFKPTPDQINGERPYPQTARPRLT